MSNIREITVEDVIELCNGELVYGDLELVLENFCQDTRLIKPGDVYVGVKGQKSDGNVLYEEAIKSGAKACILQGIVIPDIIKQRYPNQTIIIVEDTIRTLQKLAAYKRSMYDIPVVAITGSVGKTSTKDIIASVMSKEYNVLKTEGNYNSQLGAALTVLRLKEEHTAMVIELGMSELGEISRLTEIVRPTIAVITNVGMAHIATLGSRENILKAKLEILEGLQNDGKVVINNDNDLLHQWKMNSKGRYDVVTFGIENVSNIMPYNTVLREDGSTYNVDIQGKKYEVNIGIGGNHFIYNSLCAIAVGRIFNISMENILEGIVSFELTKGRMQIEKLKNNITIINDSYNANYDSMKAAVEYLGKVKSNRKIALLGDMLELAEYAEETHRNIGKEVAKAQINLLITVGDMSKFIAEEAYSNGILKENIYICNNIEEATEKLNKLIESDTAVLIKASQAMGFQAIFNYIMKKWG